MSAAGILALGNIGAGAVNSAGAVLGNVMSGKSAREQMRFQEYMSSTAHQREVKDLIAAGLNPILSATGGHGAPTGAGAMANIENPGQGLAEGLQEAARTTQLDVARIQNESRMAEANSAKADADRRNIDADTILKVQTAGRSDATTKQLLAQIEQTEQSTRTGSAQEAETKMRTDRIEQEARILRALVPFLERGSTAIQQLIDAVGTSGKLGDAAADLVEQVRKIPGALPDASIPGAARYILQLLRKHVPQLLKTPDYKTPTPQTEPEEWRGP